MGSAPIAKIIDDKLKYKVSDFSAANFFKSKDRFALENLYYPILEISPQFDRRSVSFQLSKKAQLHGWLKYKEGFSAQLVSSLLENFDIKPGGTVLDPFVGSGTTSLVSQIMGINSVGFDLLPMSKIAISAKKEVLNYDLVELNLVKRFLESFKVPTTFIGKVNSIPITEGAYPPEIDRTLAYLRDWLENNNFSKITNSLILLCVVNSLERLSYTNKDGQYLRWDYRSDKVIQSNLKRFNSSKEPIKTVLNKGVIPKVADVVLSEFNLMLSDIKHIQENRIAAPEASIEYVENSVLFELPKINSNTIDAVITSPPYCNRYDYTRTYALELAFLGLDNDQVKILRQRLLSATVENKSKLNELKEYYVSLGRLDQFTNVLSVIKNCSALQETLSALEARSKNGELNNNSVLRMVEGYFTELAFVYSELFRVCKTGAQVAFVNDNVRYGGEIIPVDYISTALAEAFGFSAVKVISLKQQKGNSSQQMKKYGRAAIRKSITVWKKPIV